METVLSTSNRRFLFCSSLVCALLSFLNLYVVHFQEKGCALYGVLNSPVRRCIFHLLRICCCRHWNVLGTRYSTGCGVRHSWWITFHSCFCRHAHWIHETAEELHDALRGMRDSSSSGEEEIIRKKDSNESKETEDCPRFLCKNIYVEPSKKSRATNQVADDIRLPLTG